MVDDKKLTELFGDWQPRVVEEQDDVDFSVPIRGKYDVEILKVEHKKIETKVGEKDVINLKAKVVADVSGNPSFRRWLDKTYWMGENQFADVPDKDDGIKQLVSALTTMGVDFVLSSKDDYEQVAKDLTTSIVGEIVRVRAYPSKTNKDKQVVTFVRPKATDTASDEGNPWD